ncbi:hypothetical protein ACEWY4_022707 [Coilia grayii]|uniref:Ig-like domain-containing protein n=1 Tax=Coilia grayii TaxID=363190 RepID=A0ABD1J0X2_9TELE
MSDDIKQFLLRRSVWVFLSYMLHLNCSDANTLEVHYTLIPGPENQLQFHQTTIFDGGAILHCSSPTLREEPRQPWVSQTFTPEELRGRDEICRGQFYQHSSWLQQISTLINNTAEVLQRRRGCTNGSGISSFDKWGINGEDFLTFDPQTRRWSPDTELAGPVAQEWNQHPFRNHVHRSRIRAVCQDDQSLFKQKRAVKTVRDTGMEVQVFAKSIPEHSSTSLWCHVMGSDLSGVRIQLTNDGVPLHSGVKLIGPRPNGDGTNQMRVQTKASLTDTERYQCEVYRDSRHHTSVTWDQPNVDTQGGGDRGKSSTVIDSEVALFAGIALGSVIFIIVMLVLLLKYWRHHHMHSPKHTTTVSLSSLATPKRSGQAPGANNNAADGQQHYEKVSGDYGQPVYIVQEMPPQSPANIY